MVSAYMSVNVFIHVLPLITTRLESKVFSLEKLCFSIQSLVPNLVPIIVLSLVYSIVLRLVHSLGGSQISNHSLLWFLEALEIFVIVPSL